MRFTRRRRTPPTGARILVIADAPPPVEGAIHLAPGQARLVFDASTDTWTAGPHTADIVVAMAPVDVDVPRLDPRVTPPTRVEPGGPSYLGVLTDGVPNLVLLDPHSGDQLRFLHALLLLLAAEGATRVLSRPTVTAARRTERETAELLRRPNREHLDLSCAHTRDDGVYAGPALLTSGDLAATVPVRLAGHLEPLDGRYHWYGTLDDRAAGERFKACRRGTVTIAVGDGPAVPASVTDRTAWGTFRVEGVGSPPFELAR